MADVIETPILIVGGGPVGLALAGDLGWRGRECLLVERTDGAIVQPRQDLVGIRTMEFCRRWGLVEAVEAAPYNRGYPQDNVYVAGSLAEGWEIGRYKSPSMNEARPPPESPARRERCPQNMFDPILRDFARSHASVSLRYRYSFLGLRSERSDAAPSDPLALVDRLRGAASAAIPRPGWSETYSTFRPTRISAVRTATLPWPLPQAGGEKVRKGGQTSPPLPAGRGLG